MTDFVEALESELRRAAERRARGGGHAWRGWRPSRLLPAAAIAVALAIGLAVVLAVRPAGENADRPARSGPAPATVPSAAHTTPRTAVPAPVGPAPAPGNADATRPAPGKAVPPAASPIPADVSPGARRSKRFGLGKRLALSTGVPVYADMDRWRYCPPGPLPLRKADVPAAVAAVLAIVPAVVPKGGNPRQDPTGAQGHGTLVTAASYAVHQCGSAMRNHSVDVGVVLPQVAKFSASLAQLDLVVARTRAGWIVFDRRH